MTSLRALTVEWADFDREPEHGICEGPTADDLTALLQTLCACGPGSGFVILARDEQNYIQAACPEEEGEPLLVEYRAGSEDRHFTIQEDVFDSARLIELFAAYGEGVGRLASVAKWVKLEI